MALGGGRGDSATATRSDHKLPISTLAVTEPSTHDSAEVNGYIVKPTSAGKPIESIKRLLGPVIPTR